MTRAAFEKEIEASAKTSGWRRDRTGTHFQRTINGVDVQRLKLQSISVRHERQAKIGDHNEWRPITMGFYRDVVIDGLGNVFFRKAT